MGSFLSPSAQKDRKAERLMKKQKMEEQARLAQEKSDLGEKRAMATSPLAGRSMLVKTTARGLMQKFGGK